MSAPLAVVPPFDPCDESYADAERNASLRRVLDHHLAGRPGRAHYELVRTFLRQARILGLAHTHLPARPLDASPVRKEQPTSG